MRKEEHSIDMYNASLKHASTPKDLEQFPWPDFHDKTRYATIKQRADSQLPLIDNGSFN